MVALKKKLEVLWENFLHKIIQQIKVLILILIVKLLKISELKKSDCESSFGYKQHFSS